MRSPDPMLPSITFVLSQAQSATEMRGNKRWGKLGVRRTKSSPSFSPHPPRYPPRLDSEFLTTVDYRFTSPPRAPSRSSFALPKDIFDADAEIEIVVPSQIITKMPSTEGSTTSGRGSARQRARVTTFMQDALCALRSRWRGMPGVRRAEHRIPFDLCN